MSSDQKMVKPYVPLTDSNGRVVTPPTADQIAQAKSDIEARWNMPLDAIMIMVHNHCFGVTTPQQVNPPATQEQRMRRKRRRQQQHHAHMKKNPQGLHIDNPSAPAGGG